MATALLLPTKFQLQINKYKYNFNKPTSIPRHYTFSTLIFSSNSHLSLSSSSHLHPITAHSHATSSTSESHSATSAFGTRLYVSGLSFRTTKESLINAFEQFGELVEANLVMDKITKRPRGFAFVRYATYEESKRAIEGMHGKFLDGRVIFVEVAKPRSETQKNKQE